MKRAIKREKRQRKREIKRAAKRDYRQAKREGKRREHFDGTADRFENARTHKEQRRAHTNSQEGGERRRKEEEDEYLRRVEAKGREMAAKDARWSLGGAHESGVVEEKVVLG